VLTLLTEQIVLIALVQGIIMKLVLNVPYVITNVKIVKTDPISVQAVLKVIEEKVV